MRAPAGLALVRAPLPVPAGRPLLADSHGRQQRGDVDSRVALTRALVPFLRPLLSLPHPISPEGFTSPRIRQSFDI